MIDINELRRLGEGQQWIGRWYDAGCETLMAERDGEHEEVAHPMPIGLVPYLVAVQPAAISELLDRLEAAEKERDFAKVEIARLHDDIHELTGERDTYKAAYNEWIAKTEWVQDELTRSKLPAKYLGMHRADVIKVEIDALRAAVRHEADCVEAAKAEIKALRAKLAEMEQQEPAGTLHDDGCFVWRETAPHQSNYAGWKMALYALPGAQPAPSLASGDVSLISEGKTPTTLLVAVADLVSQMEIVARVGFVDAPDDKDSCAAFCVAEGTWLELMRCVESLAASLAAAPEAKP